MWRDLAGMAVGDLLHRQGKTANNTEGILGWTKTVPPVALSVSEKYVQKASLVRHHDDQPDLLEVNPGLHKKMPSATGSSRLASISIMAMPKPSSPTLK
jgi:hypothetical protein